MSFKNKWVAGITSLTAIFGSSAYANDAAIGNCILQQLEPGNHTVSSEAITGFDGSRVGTRVERAVKLIMGNQELAPHSFVEVRTLDSGNRAGETFVGIGKSDAATPNKTQYYAFIGKDGSLSDENQNPIQMFAMTDRNVDMPDPAIASATMTCLGLK